MTDHATSLGNVTQPQLPPTAAERAAKRENPPGKVFRDKATASRQLSRPSLEKLHVVKLPGHPAAERP